jgi:hypothetical protein
MKPNGKNFAVRVVLVVLSAVSLFSIAGQAQTTHGSFKLPVETHWGKMVLAPGEYEFTISDALAGRILTVRSKETGWSGMIMSSDSSDLGSDKETKLLLTKSETGSYVRALCLGDAGVMLNYGTPKPGKMTRLSPPQSTTMASASGAQ